MIDMKEVPTVCLAKMSEAEIRAYVIADNKLAENAGWERELLGLEFQYLAELDVDLDLTITGFELPEIRCCDLCKLLRAMRAGIGSAGAKIANRAVSDFKLSHNVASVIRSQPHQKAWAPETTPETTPHPCSAVGLLKRDRTQEERLHDEARGYSDL